MADEADNAQRVSDQVAEGLLARARAMNAAPPTERPDPRVCVDCPDQIEAARLAAQPNAIRCALCQAAAEEARRGVAA